jgi:tRNA pseudouridine13 synthase
MELKASTEFEKRIGIWFYSTISEGIGGTIKTIPADFNVREITNRAEQEEGKYLIAELTKENWDTHGVIREIADRLRVSRNRIGFAGTKDKFAVTKQKISIWGTEENELARVNIADVSLNVIGRSNKAVSLGDLYGNEFEIVIRGVDGRYEAVKDKIDAITKEIETNGGIPNFFGVQRFGITRTITHVVGRHLIKGDINGAVISYLSDIFPGESEAAKEARMLCKSGKLKESLKIMPLRYERAMLNALIKNLSFKKKALPKKNYTSTIKNDRDSLSAFHSLPKNLQKLFVHAYQSYLFNLILSQRMKQNLPFYVAIAGDEVCFHNKFGFPDPDKVEKVTANKLEGMNRLLKRGRAFVTAPIFGYETELADGVIGAIERKVLEDEAIELGNFYIEKLPELSSKGTSRPVLLPVDLNAEISDDELNPGQLKVKLNFFLPKGTYATVLLREYMKGE